MRTRGLDSGMLKKNLLIMTRTTTVSHDNIVGLEKKLALLPCRDLVFSGFFILFFRNIEASCAKQSFSPPPIELLSSVNTIL